MGIPEPSETRNEAEALDASDGASPSLPAAVIRQRSNASGTPQGVDDGDTWADCLVSIAEEIQLPVYQQAPTVGCHLGEAVVAYRRQRIAWLGGRRPR